MKNRFQEKMGHSPLHYFIKKEYLVFLEDSMNHSHPVWIDITALTIKMAFFCPRVVLFPDTDMNGDPTKEALSVVSPVYPKSL